MNVDELDAPALVLPRVLDVHGTFLRLGFTGFAGGKRQLEHYRLDVPLFNGITVPNTVRRISHVHFVIIMSHQDSTEGRIYAKYGYPERYPKGKKIILNFKPLLREETNERLNFSSDQRLMEFERMLRLLTFNLKNFPLDLNEVVDSAEGLVNRKQEETQALVGAVVGALCNPMQEDEVMTWFEISGEPKKASHERIPARAPNAYSRQPRLPNFDRRRHVFRQVRRPV